ncbi:hypothetical protein QE382_002848 [Sphingobacterium zeae]|uniref:NACHT domain-containing protein n=1 Tax=Sphingobacterium zeae TaxID=1776859 RepID=A0ABU0U7U0_9SPHI|nr:hypothetical protein [Sphingobacterium zeae]MDQ1150864.1 hypothetical protein [Sphingobacterium zeae]
MDIIREASDKIKGISLQKLRALTLAFDTIEKNENAQLHIAIEYVGDVYIYSENRRHIEENKNYDSRNFSFVSPQVLNTIVYFLDYWMKDTIGRSKNVVFSFYSTNAIAKEKQTEKLNSLGIILPDNAILTLLEEKSELNESLMGICRSLVLDEYESQYKGKNNHYNDLSEWSLKEWHDFFNQIIWNFGVPDHILVKDQLTQAIHNYSQRCRIPIDGKEEFIRAWLRERLEDNQYEQDITQRFLNNIEIQNIFYKISNNQIPNNLYSYIDVDYSEFRRRTVEFTESFLHSKYTALSQSNSSPFYLKRVVKKHANEVRINPKSFSESNGNQVVLQDVITGDMSSLIISSKPNFLFGEIGSGKSSIISQFVIDQIRDLERTIIFIPISYLKGRITLDFEPFISAVENFVNHNVMVADKKINIQMLLRSQQRATLVIDGLDELSTSDTKLLIAHLKTTVNNYENIAVIATGRPLELQHLVNFNDWNCLTTLDLTENEIYQLLKNEALNNGFPNDEDAEADTQLRLHFLNGRKELFSIARTPLIICLLRDYLTESLEEESLGTLMYKILSKRLEWDKTDAKTSYQKFFDVFPSTYQREKIIGVIAAAIAGTDKLFIHEAQLFELINENIGQIPDRNTVVDEAIQFYKNIFLQESDKAFSFTSQPLFEISYGIALADLMRQPDFKLEIVTNNWRAVSFATAISRLKGYSEMIVPFIRTALAELLNFEGNTSYAASIVSESKNEKVAQYYFELVSLLKFRPLTVWRDEGNFNTPDSYSPYVLADTMSLAGEIGFNWFFEEYLNPHHPTHHSDEDLIAHILKNYFTIRSFQLTDGERNSLTDIIPYHMAAKTGWCGEIFSQLALVIPDAFAQEQRYSLVADSINDRLLYTVSKNVIDKGIKAGELKLILGALEIESQRDHFSKATAVRLWLELSEGPMNQVVLQSALNLAARGDDLIFESLVRRIGNEGLKPYLTFTSINMHKGAKDAAILLHEKYQVKDLYVISRPLFSQSDWTDYETPVLRKILDQVLMTDQERSLQYLLKFIPFKKDEEQIPELYLFYSLKLLLSSQDIYINHFLQIVRYMKEYTPIVRYPEIREAFRNLLESYPQYRESLQLATENLDFRLRFNASIILLACFPENSFKELENSVRAADKRISESQEWIRFCMKLNYDHSTLVRLEGLIPDLPEGARYYVLFILYHQKYSLQSSQIEELVRGLLGRGDHFDHDSNYFGGDGLNSLAKDSKLLPLIIHAFESGDKHQIKKAGHQLYYFQLSNLTPQQQAKVYLQECQDNSWALFHFQRFDQAPFNNVDFMLALSAGAESIKADTGDYPLLYECYRLIQSPNKNIALNILKKIVFDESPTGVHELDLAYRWFKTLAKNYPSISEPIGIAAWELTGFPAILDRKDYNPVLYQLAVIASEFNNVPKVELVKILQNYGSQDELTCSLLYRSGKPNIKFVGSKSYPYYLNFFAENKTKIIQLINDTAVDQLLVDSSEIPDAFLDGILSSLLYKIEIKDSLVGATSQTALLFKSIISFCRGETVDFDTLISAGDRIGWPFYNKPANANLRSTVYLIKEMMLEREGSRELYGKMLIDRIKDHQNQYHSEIDEHFKELFNLNILFPVELLGILFDIIENRYYLLKGELLYRILDYVAEKVEKKDFTYLSKLAADYIKGLLGRYEKDIHFEDRTLMFWMFALICFYVDQKSEPYSRTAYLLGLEAIFIFDDGNQYMNQNNRSFKFKGRELLNHSLTIYEKIEPRVLHEVVEFGADKGTPEIKSICKVLRIFAALNDK